MTFSFPPLMRHIAMASCMAISATAAHAQTEQPDISKMGHFKYRSYLKENGFKTQSGQVVKVGDQLTVLKGSLPDKRYAFIYQSQTGFASGTSMDGSVKAYLNSSAKGRTAVVKSFMTSGMRKGEYAVFAVVGVGEPFNYWVELDNAIDAGEIKINQQ